MEKIMEKEITKALKLGEVPVAAVILYDGKIIAKAHNNVENNNDPFGHAEILVIKKAIKKLKTWKLSDCELYVTLEPCDMCIELIKRVRINKIYYFVDKNKEVNSKINLIKLPKNEFSKWNENKLSEFFKSLRSN